MFDHDGNECGSFGGPKTDGTGLIHPHGLGIVERNGQEVVVCVESHLSRQDKVLMAQYNMCSCLKVFSFDGKFIERIDGDFVNPRHIRPAGPEANSGYIIPDFRGRILFTDSEFNITSRIGVPFERFEVACETEYDLGLPHDACVLQDGRLLVTDFNGRVLSLR